MGTSTPDSLYLRVNGIEIEKARARRKLVNGKPTDEHELVIEDPKLGMFAVEGEGFILEVSRNRKTWEITSAVAFLKMVL
jgi:hypothetical protein